MRELRVLIHLVRADFLERVRRYSFLITLGMMVYVGYLAVPPIESGALTVNLGGIRGIYNSAWVGSMIALLSSMLLSLPGFYLVKNAVERDRRTGVGQIIATTPLNKVLYTLGKAVGNFYFLALIVAVVVIAAGATQLLRGEIVYLDVWALVAPFLFVTLPALTLVAAVAVLFECVPFLQRGFGNICFFVLYTATIIVSLSGATFSSQGVIEQPINDLFGATVIGASMLQAAHTAFPERVLNFGIGYSYSEGPIETFQWDGVNWTTGVVLGRAVWPGVALGIVLLAALVFKRFDPARERRGSARRKGARARVLGLTRSLHLPTPDLARFLAFPRFALPPFGRVLVAELLLALKGLRWWWYVVALGLFVAGVTRPADEALRNLLPVAWIWPVLVWSGIGVRESRHRTGSIVFSAPHPLWRQLPASWLAGIIVTILAGGGVGIRLLVAGEWDHLLAWGVAALFIPTLALALGVWSGSSKLFEALYVVWWYIGPVSGVPRLDFMGLSDTAIAMGLPLVYLAGTIVLLALTVIGRRRQIYTS